MAEVKGAQAPKVVLNQGASSAAVKAVVPATMAEVPKTAKAVPEVTSVAMKDGRTVAFTGKRKMIKDYVLTATSASLSFDFINGESRKVVIRGEDPLLFQYVAHGATQKIGDETAGETDVEDMLAGVDSMISRLAGGVWGKERSSGDGFSGAGVVVRAIMETSGKDQAFVKAFLDKKLEAGKASGLTRQGLYAAFRAPGTKTAPIIERMEKEKTVKAPAIDANAALGELGA